MSTITLEVDFPAGVSIKRACFDAVELATKLGVKIRFECNDKIVYVLPNNNVHSLVSAYYDAVENGDTFVCSLDRTEEHKE